MKVLVRPAFYHIQYCVQFLLKITKVCGGFAAERRAGKRCRSTAVSPAATALQHGAAARRSAAKADSVVLTAELTRLNTNQWRFHAGAGGSGPQIVVTPPPNLAGPQI